MRRLLLLMSLMGLWLLAACGAAPGGLATQEGRGPVALAEAIMALGPGVDPEEASRAAHLAFSYTRVLAEQYQITDPPLIHNTKVNMGLKPRGLCWHWAEDLETRLAQEDFRTLTLHRAIANADNPFRIDHSTVIVSRAGDGMYDGIVLDPWRNGGVLHWVPVREDTRYNWIPRRVVFEAKRAGLPVPTVIATSG